MCRRIMGLLVALTVSLGCAPMPHADASTVISRSTNWDAPRAH